MDHKLLKAYWERWQAVEAIERRENKATSIAQRWQEMNAIIRLATGLGLSSDENQDQERIVWQHWSRLKSSR